jgi:hypothetical protein
MRRFRRTRTSIGTSRVCSPSSSNAPRRYSRARAADLAARRGTEAFGELSLHLLARLLGAEPERVTALVDERRGRVGDAGLPMWNPGVGAALWVEIARELRASFTRMVPRLLQRIDTSSSQPIVPRGRLAEGAVEDAPITAGELVASRPMDEVVARLLCDPRALAPVAARPRAATGDHSPLGGGLRPITEWRWLGERDPKLWNWVEIGQPFDATPEEVAAQFFYDPLPIVGQLTGTAPRYRVPPKLAVTVPSAHRYMPSGEAAYDDDPLALARSTLAVDVAIEQARKTGNATSREPDFERLLATLERSDRQLERARALLTPWSLDRTARSRSSGFAGPAPPRGLGTRVAGPASLEDRLVPAREFVARYREGLAGVSDERMRDLAPVIEGQQELVFAIVGTLQRLAIAYAQLAAAGPDTPVARVLEAYALALGQSHLLGDARAQLAAAEGLARTLTLDLLDESRRSNEDHRARLRDQEQKGRRAEGATGADSVGAYRDRVLDLRERAARGEPIEDETALLAAELRLQAIELRIGTAAMEAANVREAIRDSETGFWPTLAVFAGKAEQLGLFGPERVRPFQPSLQILVARITAFTSELEPRVLAPIRAARARIAKQPDLRVRVHELEAIHAEAARSFEQVIERHELGRTLQVAITGIERQQLRTAMIKLAAVIAVSVVGGAVGAVVGSFVRAP